MLHILLEMPFPRVQLCDMLCPAPHFHGILCVFMWISSSQHGQSSGEGIGITVTFPSLLTSRPTFGIFLFTSNFPVQLMEQVPPSYLLPFIRDLAVFYSKQHETDGETKASREEVN